jgi:hypothetical protein
MPADNAAATMVVTAAAMEVEVAVAVMAAVAAMEEVVAMEVVVNLLIILLWLRFFSSDGHTSAFEMAIII